MHTNQVDTITYFLKLIFPLQIKDNQAKFQMLKTFQLQELIIFKEVFRIHGVIKKKINLCTLLLIKHKKIIPPINIKANIIM
jgi:hypothetical protein